MSEWMKLIERFHQALCEAQEHRDEKNRWVTDSELEWMVFERTTMLTLVNEERAKRSLPPATMADIKKCDGWASGHVDYTHKFALYCAELAVNKPQTPP